MKDYQIVIIVIVFLVLGYFLSEKVFASKKTNSNTQLTNPDESVGKVDLWCENGKYYKRTVTKIYGQPTMLELTRPQFDALVAQGVSYSGCNVDNNGNITA